MKEKVVVTGGAGFVGSHMVEALVERGYEVVVMDSLFRGKFAYIEPLVKTEKARFIKADIRDEDMVRDAMKGASYVVHKAAVCINYSLANPGESFEVNVNGTYNILRAAHEAKVKKLVYASSASVYGDPLVLPMTEESPLRPITPYCIGKIAGENMLGMKGLEGLPYVAFRYFNIYGPRQSIDAYYTSVIVSFVKRVLRGIPPRIMGDGKQSMDFVNVKDVVGIDIEAMESDIKGGVFNVGSGRSVSIKEIAGMVVSLTGSDMEPEYVKGEPSIVQRRQADISKVSRAFGFRPQTTLEKGMAALIEDIRLRPSYY